MPQGIDILTLFPEAIEPYTKVSLLGKAQGSGLCPIRLHNIRDFTTDNHRSVDDSPYGGGAGMVMKIEPIDKALTSLHQSIARHQRHTIVLAANGTPFTQDKAIALADLDKTLTLICGRYEGIDQRVIDYLADEAISIGPYVLAGGELPALVVAEAVVRLIPGVLGNPESLIEESYSKELMKEYPHYTKPAEYKGWKVPAVLLSGDHAAIQQWRDEQRKNP